MDQHDRTFLEITHAVLYLVLTSLALIGALRLGTALGGAAADQLLSGILAALVAGLTVAPASRLLYRLNGFTVDEGHARRLRRPAEIIGTLVIFAVGLFVMLT